MSESKEKYDKAIIQETRLFPCHEITWTHLSSIPAAQEMMMIVAIDVDNDNDDNGNGDNGNGDNGNGDNGNGDKLQ